ncbi:MAG: response regulator transcription factor [Ignavibacteriae bacterium]|nr:response regulator transcription factor [Ignavibacteriota bacterium]
MIKVTIIEDHPDFREGLAHLLNATEGFICIDVFGNAEDGISQISPKTGVILLDIGLPGMTGIEAVPLLKTKLPQVKIIMLTVFDDDDNILKAIMAGADGYLLKKTSPTKILSALEEAVSDGSPMTASIAKKVITLFKNYIPVQTEDFSLSNRELEVLQLIVDGLDNNEIAEKLFISIQTVRNHIRHIYEKLHVHSKSQAVVKALKEGLV